MAVSRCPLKPMGSQVGLSEVARSRGCDAGVKGVMLGPRVCDY